jgi:hypothetical protein
MLMARNLHRTRWLVAAVAALTVAAASPAAADVTDVTSDAELRSIAAGGIPQAGNDVTQDFGENLSSYTGDLEVTPQSGFRSARARSTIRATVNASVDSIAVTSEGSTDIAAETNFEENFVGAGGNVAFSVAFQFTERASFTFTATANVATNGKEESTETVVTFRCDCAFDAGSDCVPFELELDAEDSPDLPLTATGSRSGTIGPGNCSIFAGTFSSLGSINQTSRSSYTVSLNLATIPAEEESSDTFTWVGGETGDFADAESWDPPQVPTFVVGDRSDIAVFRGGPDPAVDFDGAALAAVAERAVIARASAQRNIGNLLVSGKQVRLVDAALNVKGTRPDRFSLEVNDGGSLTLVRGTVDVQNGVIGRRRTGTLVVGDQTAFFSNDFFFIGGPEVGGSDGFFRVDAGGLAHSFGNNAVRVASVTRTGSRATVQGADAEWIVDPPLRIGGNVAGRVNLHGTVDVREGGHLDTKGIAEIRPGGRAIVQGLGSDLPTTWTAIEIRMGDGELDVLPGGTVTAGKVVVGAFSENVAELAGRGLLLVDGGTLQAVDLIVGDPAGGTGGVLQIGGPRNAGGSLDVTGDFEIARGKVIVQEIPDVPFPSSNNLAVTGGEIRIFPGGRLETRTNAAVGVSGSGIAELTGSFAEELLASWTIDGTLGIGSDDLSGFGTLRMHDALVIADNVVIGRFGRIESDPLNTGSLLLADTIHNGGIIRAGIAIHGELDLEAGGVIEQAVNQPNAPAPQQQNLFTLPFGGARFADGMLAAPSDVIAAAKTPPLSGAPLTVTGNATLDGTLVLQFRSGFAPKTGDKFDILQATGTVTGAFAEVEIQGLDPATTNFATTLDNGALVVTSQSDTVALQPLALKAPKKVKETKKGAVKITVQRKTKTTVPLLVNYAVGGTAENGIDYASLPGTVEIPAGKKAGVIPLRPLDDLLIEGSKTIEIQLLPGDGYSLPVADKATIELVDNEVKK